MKIKQVDKVDLAFGGKMADLMPPKEEYAEYRKQWHYGDSWGFKLFNDMFYRGLTKLELKPKEGIDSKAAFAHIRVIMISWEPSHEDKTAAVAYLFEHWFESGEWEAKKKD